MAEQKIFPQQIDTTGSTNGQVLVSNGSVASWTSGSYTGSQGYYGSVGYSGSAGYTGSASTVAGYTGSRGTDGVIGYWGSVGYSGSVGSQGYWGSVGYSGSRGTDGVIGYWGSTGYSGSAGVGYSGSAATGYTGSFGYTGSGYTYNIVPYYSFSTQFNGTTISYGTTSSFNYLHNGASNWTIECWVYLTSTSSGAIFATTNGSAQIGLIISISNSVSLGIDVQITRGVSGVSNIAGIITSANVISTNTWTHIAVTFNTSTKLVTIYINGSSVSTSVISGGYVSTVGYSYSSSNASLVASTGAPGYISNFRITQAIVYTGNFTVPTDSLATSQSSNTNIISLTTSDVKLLICQSAGFVNNSTTSFTITNNGSAVNVLFNPFGSTSTPALSFQNVNITGSITVSSSTGVAGQALISSGNGNPYWASIAPMYNYSAQFNGSSYLTVSSTAFDFSSSSSCTIECWIYATSNTTNGHIYQNYTTTGSSGTGQMLGWSSSTVYFSEYNGSFAGSAQFGIVSAATLSINTWYHIAIVKNGTGSSNIKMYINGVLATTGTLANFVAPGSGTTYIGARNFNGVKDYFPGYISNLRVVKGVAVYTDTFTPSGPLATTQIAGVNISAITGTSTSFLSCNAITLTDSSSSALAISNSGVVSSATTYPPVFTASTVAVSTTAITSVRQQFVANGSTTTFTVAGGYTPNYLSVFLNGVLLSNGSDVTATNGATITIAAAPPNGSLIDVVGTVPTTYSSITPVAYSVQFNGTSQYMTVPNNAAFTFGTGDFTVECWTYLTSTGVNASIFSKRASASIYGFTFGTDSGNHFTAGIPNAAGNAWVQLLASSITFSANVWYHFACVRASGTVTLYVNGIPVASGAASNSIYDDGTAAVIGCTGSVTPGAYFPGYVSNLRIVKGVAVYTGPFTPAGPLAAVQSATSFQTAITGTQTSLLTCNGPTIIDGSTNAFTITNNGTATVSTSIVPTFTNVTINNSGYTGSAGAGYTGSVGTTGYYGSVGYTGSWGYYGSSGYTGSLGYYGSSGYTGSWGYFGSTGYTGSASTVIGYWGSVGYTGSASTVIGYWGSVGYTGSASTVIGYWGSTGYAGSTGAGYTGSAATIAPGYTFSSQFNGSNQSLYVASNAAFAFGTGDFTIEAWVYLNSLTGIQPICQSDPVGSSTNDKWFFAYSSNALYFNTHGVGASVSIPWTSVTGTWYHVAISRSSGTYNLFVNGVKGTNTTSGTFASLSQNGIAIGAMSTPYYLNGFISNLRLVKGTAVYTSSFTPPTSPLSAISGTSLLTCNAITPSDSSTNNFQITNNGAVTTTAVQTPFSATTISIPTASLTAVNQQFTGDGSTTTFNIAGGYTPNAIAVYYNGLKLRNGSDVTVTSGAYITFTFTPLNNSLIDVIASVPTTYSSITPVAYSVAFNGTNQYLTVPSNAAFAFGTADFTVEAWVWCAPIVGNTYGKMILDGRPAATNGAYFNFGLDNTGKPGAYLGSNGYTSPTAISNNTWVHLAFTRSSGAVRLFVNGAILATGTGNADNLISGGYFIGQNAFMAADTYWNGYISNIRIVKGVAVYTGVFTPPQTPLAATQLATNPNVSAITGTQTSLLTCNGPTIVDGSTNAFTITNTNSTLVSTAVYPTFTNVTINVPSLSTYSAAYLVVAGGGGGAAGPGGGGGAGGLLTNSTLVSAGTTYTITVGAGGASTTGSWPQNVGVNGNNGSNSLLGAIATAIGGGGGGGLSGGSGGGGGGLSGNSAGGTATSGQGNSGGLAQSSAGEGGGGGGAGAAGSATQTTGYAGNGGIGLTSTISGLSVTYGGGGGGGGNSGGAPAGSSNHGIGGVGGGGDGGWSSSLAAVAGTANTGGGGGGGGRVASSTNYSGAAGGSGVVIIAVPSTNYSGTTTGSPTVTTVTTYSGSYKIITFTSSGTFTA